MYKITLIFLVLSCCNLSDKPISNIEEEKSFDAQKALDDALTVEDEDMSVLECQRETRFTFCERLAKVCQSVSEKDNCGQDRTENCGSCEAGFACNNNVCEADFDKDSIPDSIDNCVTIANPNQNNSDTDELGDLCDNCPVDSNQSQKDSDNNGRGDVCDIKCVCGDTACNRCGQTGCGTGEECFKNDEFGKCEDDRCLINF